MKIKIKYLHIAILILGTAFLASGAFHTGVWFDEAYSIGLVRHGFFDMIKIATYDVHPHLYYILLKLYSYIFGNGIIALRLFSVVGGALFAFLGFTHIRRDFGEKTGFWFTFYAFTLTCTFKYALQIRMYTIAPLFVTLTAIYAYRMIKNSQKKNIVLFVVFSILAAYTHYFAFFTVCAINIMLLIYYIKHKLKLKGWFKLAVIQVGAYIPGLLVFAIQISTDGASWITVNTRDMFDTFNFHFIGDASKGALELSPIMYNLLTATAILLYAVFGYILYRIYKEDKENARPAVLALIVYFSVIAFSLGVSLFRPIYYVRYTIVIYGMIIFAFAYLTANTKYKIIKTVVPVLLVLITIIRVIPIYKDTYNPTVSITNFSKLQIQTNDIIVIDLFDGNIAAIQYPDNDFYYYNWGYWNVETAYKAFSNHTKVVSDLDFLKNFEGRIWVTGRGPAYEKIMALSDVKEVSSKQIKLGYYDYDFEFVLIEKI